MKYKILIIPIVIILLIFIWMAVTDKQDKPVRSEPELRFNGVVEYTEPKKSQNLRLMATNGLVFVNNLETQTVNFANDPSNPYAMKVSLYLGDGTILYESDEIKPGDTITDIKLLEMPRRGTYSNSLMVYRFYDSRDGFVNQCEFPIEIKIV